MESARSSAIRLIKDVPVREARRLRREERRRAEIVGHLATTAEEFERLANAVEGGYEPDEPDEGYDLTATERAELDEFLSDDEAVALDSLELGLRVWFTRLPPFASFRLQAVGGIRVIGLGPTRQS